MIEAVARARTNIVARLIERFMPGEALDEDRRRRTRFAIASMFLVLLATMIASLRLLAGGHFRGMLVIGGVSASSAVMLLLVRRGHSLRLMASLLAGVLTTAVASMGWIGGGLGTPSFYALGAVSLMTTLIAGVRVGVAWTLIGALVLVAYIALYATGLEPVNRFGANAMKGLHGAAGLLILGLLATLGLVYERFKNNTLANMARARVEADRANRAKSAFLAQMSHELRNPMNGVLGLAALVREARDGAERERLLDALVASGENMKRLLDELLDLSKVEAGKLTLERVPFAIHEVVENVMTLMQPVAAKKGLELSWQASGDAPATLEGDPTRVAQVLLNLVSNAIKFTDAGAVTVRVSVAPAPAPDHDPGSEERGSELCFEVNDTGPGMTAAQAARVFEEFVQAESSTARYFGGTGLGLTIARRLCELMAGTIEVESERGRGSTFRARMYLAAHTGALADAPAPEERAAPSADALHGLHVLVAEDNAINRMLLGRMLESLGAHADLVDDGAAAVAAIRDHDYDCVLMDCQMPIMDGLQATAAIRAMGDERASAIPIVAVTASAMPDERRDILAAGMDDVLIKPIVRDGLQAVLTRMVALRPPVG